MMFSVLSRPRWGLLLLQCRAESDVEICASMTVLIPPRINDSHLQSSISSSEIRVTQEPDALRHPDWHADQLRG
jgi:hypothetical protein